MRLIDASEYAGQPTNVTGRDGFIDESAPLEIAALYLAAGADADGGREIVRWQEEFFISRTSHYEILSSDELRSNLYRWLERQKSRSTGERIKPRRRLVDEVIAALAALSYLRIATVPAWLTASNAPPPAEVVSCRNGLLHLPTRQLLPHDRSFFTLNALPYDFMHSPPKPAAWLNFLHTLWEDDTESVEALQEMFGLLLTHDTKYQKIFLIVGPRRAGKGTIARMLTALVGMENVTAPTLPSLGMQFGLESMIGKSVALISDARLGGRADTAVIAENLLRISGEDAVAVHRKYKPPWNARLPIRFVMLSNELPGVTDQSSALPGRFIILRLTRSFYGKEDLGLEQRLLAELSSILIWALDGLDRLRRRGYFRQPKSAVQMVQELETLASPIKAFVADCCLLEPGSMIACASLFASWKTWSDLHGRHAGTLQVFGKDLRAAYPTIDIARPRIGGNRDRYYNGIRLRQTGDPDTDDQ